jgi:radical SAM protein with 4Fe4S-binding SPASM domain
MAEIKDVITEVDEMLKAWSDAYGIFFSPSFNVTGGEPFLRQDIFLILEEMSNRDFDIYLLSNGILIDREKARILAGLAVKGVQVSIEGPERVHNDIRGTGSFSSSLRGVQYLLDRGIKVTLNVTLSGINADHLVDMVALSSALGVQRLGFSRLVPSGRGKGLLEAMLKKERVEELYREIFSLRTNGLDIVTGDPVASQMNVPPVEGDSATIPAGGCAAAVSGITFLPDGTIVPCRRLPVSVGNVRKDSIREVWASSEVLQSLRDRLQYKGKCRNCSRWFACRGCRAIAYAYARANGDCDFLAEDPQCFLEE